jgi:Na+-transporting methylmalonyl-CoA/oxaloacetate decarboxylase gamma subunit
MSDELKNLLIQVISSWQVIVVTAVLILYVSLVNYVGNTSRRRKPNPPPKSAKQKKAAPAPEPDADDDPGPEEKKEK